VECGPVSLRSGAGAPEIPRPAEQWLPGPMGWVLVGGAGCSASKSCPGKDVHELGVRVLKF
jgi:hypothetical protein